MEQRKEIFTNRHGQKIVVLIDQTENQKGLAFVMHGLGGFKEQPQMRTFAQAFLEKGFTVINFDTTNTLGESDGTYENATCTNYYQDLEDVIKWASTQNWYQEPFYLTGHSLGGFTAAFFAENFPDKVKGIAPISTVISGKLTNEALKKSNPENFEKWEKTGWWIYESNSKPGVIKKLNWHQFRDDIVQYNLFDKIDRLIMPILIIVGENDSGTPPEHQQLFLDKVPSDNKELHIIEGARHTFREPEHLAEIKEIFLKWVGKTN